jgi:hypothetical protein
MTNVQRCIIDYLKTQFAPGCLKYKLIGENTVLISDLYGESMRLTMNLHGDIIEELSNNKEKIIAIADVSHNSNQIEQIFPVKWTTIPY